MAQVIDGKALAKKIRENLKVECNELKEKGIVPKLAVIMVGGWFAKNPSVGLGKMRAMADAREMILEESDNGTDADHTF